MCIPRSIPPRPRSATRKSGHGRIGAVVRIDYGQPGVRLDLWRGTTQAFDGIDRLGRIIQQRWRVAGGSDLDRYKYGYDRDSNRFYKQNTVGSGLDEFYTYDHLNRLSAMQRGTPGNPPKNFVKKHLI